MNPTHSRSSQHWLWLTPVVLMLAITYLYPLGFDNNTYQSMAWQLVEKGKLPYVGTWDQNFPGIVYLHSLAIMLFGNSNGGFRLLDILIQLGIAVGMHRAITGYYGRQVADFATIFYIGLYVSAGAKMLGQRDVYAAAAAFGAVYLASRSTEAWWRALVSGILLGAAILIRPTYAALVLPLILMIRDRSLGSIITLVAGSCIIPLIGLWPYIMDAVKWQAFYTSTIRFNTEVYGSTSQRLPFGLAMTYPLEWLSSLCLVGAAITLYISKHFGAEQRRILTWCFICAVIFKAMVYWMAKYLPYHYAPVFIFLTPFIGIWLSGLAQRLNSVWLRQAFAVVFAALFVIASAVRSPIPIIAAASGSLSKRMDVVEGRYGTNWYENKDRLALYDYIQKHTTHDDEIELSSMDNEIVWKLERSQCTRFTLVHPLGMLNDGKYSSDQIKWRQEFVDSIRSRKPKLVLLTSEPKKFMTFLYRSPEEILTSIPGFRDMLSRLYRQDTVFGPWKVYVRKE